MRAEKCSRSKIEACITMNHQIHTIFAISPSESLVPPASSTEDRLRGESSRNCKSELRAASDPGWPRDCDRPRFCQSSAPGSTRTSGHGITSSFVGVKGRVEWPATLKLT